MQERKIKKFYDALSLPQREMDKLRELSWIGIPSSKFLNSFPFIIVKYSYTIFQVRIMEIIARLYPFRLGDAERNFEKEKRRIY